ncbi:MAG: hypothetical protein ACRCU6_05485 [Fusobacteriaceae bacterium]
MRVKHKRIPTYTYETDTWSQTTFSNQQDFGEFLLSIFKEPGEYQFDHSTLNWNIHAKNFKKQGYYTDLLEGSKERIEFFQNEKSKCRKGIIWKHNGKTWYIPGDYYLILNFLKVPSNKEKGQNDDFCTVRDVQYQMSNYEKIAECFHKHAVILKRRQCMSSNMHAAKFIGVIWFEKTKRMKMLAYNSDYLYGTQGTWSILQTYREFLNVNTDWKRDFHIDTKNEWAEGIKYKDQNGRWILKGRNSSIKGITLNKDPKSGIGGPSAYVFYEEAGSSSTMDQSLQFLNPSLESGNEKVGIFMAAGSVGDLTDCAPLQRFMEKPDLYEILKVPTKWWDETGEIRMAPLFIPAQYGMPQAVDEYGNSLVEKALSILKETDTFKKENSHTSEEIKSYNIWKSQNPTTVAEAFSYREDLFFQTKEIQRRQDQIKILKEEGTWVAKQGILEEDSSGNISFTSLKEIKDNRPTEMGYPVNPEIKDKRGVVTIFEDPVKNPPSFLYFGGVDPIEGGPTETSDSLFSIYIVSRLHRVFYTDEQGERRSKLEGGKLVASYTGRYDETDDVNKIGELLIRYYNAYTAVERNKRNFIDHFKRKKLALKHLAKTKELTLFAGVDIGGTKRDDYGVNFGNDGKAEEILNVEVKNHIWSILDKKDIVDSSGKEKTVKTWRQLDFISDYWLLEEMKQWHKGKNADRLRAYGLAVIAANSFEATFTEKRVEVQKEDKPKPPIKKHINLLDRGMPFGFGKQQRKGSLI